MADLKRVARDESQAEQLLPPDTSTTPSSIGTPCFTPTVDFAGINNDIMSKTNSNSLEDRIEPYVIRTSQLRWLTLFLFVLYSMSNAFQWIQYSIISDIIGDYYGVSFSAIKWTSVIYMVLYIPLIFPATWLLSKKGLRTAVLIGSFGTALGAWIKCASVSPDRFYVTMIGQTIVAASQIFILGIPAMLAAVWFGAKEVSTACSIGVLGNQIGIALGFFLPRELVHKGTNLDHVGDGLSLLFYGTATFCTVLFVAIIFGFKAAPPLPPSPAAAAAAELEENYLHSIIRLMKNKNYCLLLITYGVNVGVFYAVSIILDPTYLFYFPNDNNSGRVGLTIVVAGMLGSGVSGFWLDRTHKFKETTLALYIFSFTGMVMYTFFFRLQEIWLMFVIAFLLGFFMTGYLPVGFEFAAEITYPESEGTSSGLLNASAQVFGIIFTEFSTYLLENFSDTVANLFLCSCLLVGIVMTVFIKAELKRQMAQKCHLTCKDDEEKGNLTYNHAIQ